MSPDENVKRDDEPQPEATTQAEVLARMGREGYVRSIDRATGEVREFSMWIPASWFGMPHTGEKGNGDAE